VSLAAAIEKTRRDLLELTARNRLVHTPLEGKRKTWIEIVQENSDSIFDLLVRREKTLKFLPLDAGDQDAGDDEERKEFLRAFESSGDEEVVAEARGPFEAEPFAGAAEDRLTDLYLQTALSKEKLEKQLLRCFYDARTAEEEQGVSILYLACGFLQWREAANSSVNRYAPLLLLPVELSRNTARSHFRLRFRNDEIVTNLSIQARLEQDFGIRLPDLPESVSDDDTWKPSAYFEQVHDLIQGRDGWEVLEDRMLLWFFSFTKFLMFRDLSPDAWPEGSELENNELIENLLGDGFVDSSALPPLCSDDEPLDRILNPAEVIHVTDADSSQAIVIEEISRGRSLVVQGPPGTGKSQTITNAIAAAVHAGKRVLFVAEKMAALEVVQRRLESIGLGPMTLELHSHKARKREVLEELKATLDQGIPTGTKTVAIEDLRNAAIRLRRHDATLHQPVGQSGMSPFQAIGELMRLSSEDRRALRYKVSEATQWTPREFEQRRHIARELDQLLEASGSPESNPWRGTCCDPMPPADLERLLDEVRQADEHLSDLQDANADLSGCLGIPVATSLLAISQNAQLASHLLKCPEGVDRECLADTAWESEIDRLVDAISNAKRLKEDRAAISRDVNDAAWDVDWSQARIAIAGHGKSWFRFFNASYRQAIGMLRGVCTRGLPQSPDDRLRLMDSIIAVKKAAKKLDADQDLASRMLGSAWRGTDSAFEKLDAITNWVKQTHESEWLRTRARAIASTHPDLTSLREPLTQIAKLLKRVDSQLTELTKRLQLDVRLAVDADNGRSATLTAWRDAFCRWLSSPEQLSHYLATMLRVNSLGKGGLADLVAEICCGDLGPGEVEDQLKRIQCEAILDQAWRERRELAEFHGESFEKLRETFAGLDQERIRLSQLQVAKKHHEQLPLSSADGGQVGVVRREINKRRRHMPIRKLIKEAGQAIQKIKPVFMMSPLSVAQYLEPGAVEFDLLVIDEASQVQPVDALGAIARSKQIVVVGDQKQLPPTSFFSRISGEDADAEDDETTNASDLESILGLCEAQGLPCRMLRWHYRSRHESLIAVSNRQFYDDRLFIVPSPLVSGGPLGLKLRYIEDGKYDRGGSRVNRNEARAVAEAVIEHAKLRPELSLGVATFSAAQRDAIRDEIERLRKESPQLEDFFTTGGAHPFFVKSLENVQGDERDVIFISVGYAKDNDGYFAQNFGPLNREGGERRLNVLISRASSACEVFVSLKADEIDLSRTNSEGVAALKMYLHYAEHGHLEASQSHGDADSVFEEQVAKALRNRGLEVDHQIGVGGFFIDLAIRDSTRRGRYLLGIECDGAQYHSARWVRDRDRIRQQVLESRGWKIHRIWSTDWFQRPEEQLAKVLEALDDAKTHWDQVDQSDAEVATVIQSRVSVSKTERESHWQRLAIDSSATDDGQTAPAYEEAAFEINDVAGSPADLSSAELATLVERIVELEAPIHLDEVGRRCITLLGKGRLVASVKRKISEAADSLERQQSLERRDAFLYRQNQIHFPVRNRRELANTALRKADYIAPEELRTAILEVIREHIGTEETETISSVARRLGVNNGQPFQRFAKTQIDKLAHDGRIDERSGRLFVGEAAVR
jgi:very-short-patch-repair endonuclease